jgi:hypothetical protein
MAVETSIRSKANTCVLLAPNTVDIGTHVTDAVRAGGWTLKRTDQPLDAMIMLCTLEQAQRACSGAHAAKHMLLLHRDLNVDVLGPLAAAVRKHLPAVKVHEIQAPQRERERGEDGDPVVGRIGKTIPIAAPAHLALERDAAALADVEVHGADVPEEASDVRAPHEVTRDEIAMLLSDETGLPPRPGQGERRGAAGADTFPGAGHPGAGERS